MTIMPPAVSTEADILLRESLVGITTLTLNRPQARNALNRALMAALHEALDAAARDASVKIVVIAARGPVFCSGHDLKEIRSDPARSTYEAVLAQCSRLMQSIVRLPKPVIACVQGTATAAGCQLVATCDLAVAALDAQFATPGVNIGLFCSTPMVALSRNIGRKQAMEMLLTGEMIDATTAVDFGLINRAVASEALHANVMELAGKIASKSPLTLKIGKEAFYRQIELGLSDAYDYASETMVRNLLARDAEEGIDAFLQKRPAEWRGC